MSSRRRATRPHESWSNLNAMNDVVEAVLRTTDRLVVAALGGNAAAAWRHAGPGRGRGLVPHGQRSQPALPQHGPVRLGVLDVLAAAPGGRRDGRAADERGVAGERGDGCADRAGGSSGARPGRGVHDRGRATGCRSRRRPGPPTQDHHQDHGTSRGRAPAPPRRIPADRTRPHARHLLRPAGPVPRAAVRLRPQAPDRLPEAPGGAR